MVLDCTLKASEKLDTLIYKYMVCEDLDEIEKLKVKIEKERKKLHNSMR